MNRHKFLFGGQGLSASKAMFACALVVVWLTVRADAYEDNFKDLAPVPVTVRCREPGCWKIDVARVPQTEKGLGELEIRLTADQPSVPPLLSVVLTLPQCERPYFWRPGSASVEMPPNWRSVENCSCRPVRSL